jgi:hypothetical protein
LSTNGSRKWWLIGGAWALLLVVLGVWSSFYGQPTIRDQSPITAGKNTIDRVVGQVSASLPAGWLLDDSGYQQTPCDLTPWREGVVATRMLTLSGPQGGEPAALSKVASTFDDARVSAGESFFYDAGDFVSVRGRVTGAGTLGIKLSTGCRPR